ncbi:UNVERIFIED_CONTAM: DCN1-like protein 4 [Sesamum calycinum]|uniref:Defective in cullin neddylation protein n=1 Tax=Sesamum calycinum TaxID=2727403 RepID=A0AAW2T011_9LAMI
MPRTSSRKGPTNSSASSNSSTVDLFRAASGRAASKELERIDQLFYSYSSDGSSMIDPEGIESLCSDLEVDHTDVRILMLAWENASRETRILHPGKMVLAQDEWRRGLKALRADTILKLKKALVDLEKEVRRPSNFADFYAYAFRYCLTEEKQKSIDIESICLLLDLVLGSQFQAQVDALIQYLKIQSDYKVINMDQWMGFYRFCNEVKFPDLSNYDPDQAWTLILDNFVDWLKSKRG